MRSAFSLVVGLVVSIGSAQAAAPTTVVMLGDSITKGVRQGVAVDETFSSMLAKRFEHAGIAVQVVNQGVGGETTAGALARFATDIVPLKPRIVVLMYGTNDCHVDAGKSASRLSRAEFRANLEKLIAQIRAAGAEPMLMTEPCYAQRSPANGLGEHGNVRLAQYMADCRQVAAGRDAVLIDIFANWTAAQNAGQSIEEWTTDGYHPNPLGHQQIAESVYEPLAAAISDANAGAVDFDIKVEELLSHDDRKFLWYHPRAVVFPNSSTPVPVVESLITLQKHLIVSDHYDGLATMQRGSSGEWQPPAPISSLAWRKDTSGATVAVCDVTPGFHQPTGKVLAIGAKILYDDAGTQLTSRARSNEVAYAILTPSAGGGDWSEWKTLELPETEGGFFLATAGCAQWLVEPDGGVLVPVYHKGPTGEAYTVTVFRCSFDGQQMRVQDRGPTLELAVVRGLCEPSLARYRGRYYLTLRNDLGGYVATSDDGLNYSPIKPWKFDDGAELGSYNTQQHWLVHSGGLFLVYTRRGANNDHIIRNRAPLFMARVDADSLQVIRSSEQVVIPERGGELGNFGANPASATESWVTVGEGVWSDDARQRGARGTVFVARIQWSRPNRLRGGSGPLPVGQSSP